MSNFFVKPSKSDLKQKNLFEVGKKVCKSIPFDEQATDCQFLAAAGEKAGGGGLGIGVGRGTGTGTGRGGWGMKNGLLGVEGELLPTLVTAVTVQVKVTP